MIETINIMDFEFELRRSNKRKTVGITVDRGGELILSIPHDFPINNLEEIVHEKRFWIYKKLALKEMLLYPGRKREFVNGEGFLYLGKSYRLRFINSQNTPLKLKHGNFLLLRKEIPDARHHFIDWYVSHAIPFLSKRVALYQDRIGANPTGIKVRDLKSRWGSCSKNGNLNFHWRVILLPTRIIEYIVVHELIHLIEPHHTSEFWRRMERVLPDFAQRKKWLADNGVKADL